MVEELVQTAIFAAHKYATGGHGGPDAVDLDIIGRYGIHWLRGESHLVDDGTVAFGESQKVNREQDHRGAGGQA